MMQLKWVEKLNPKEDTEEDMLDFAFDVKDNSRLSCQISVTDELQIIELQLDIESEKINLNNLSSYLKPGAARNAIDCAFWDLKCKIEKRNIWSLLGEKMPNSIQSCYTIVLNSPDKMIAPTIKQSVFI